MLMGYSVQSWLNVVVYLLFMVALSVSIYIGSTKLNYICFEKKKVSHKVNRQHGKKSHFIDVA